MATIAGFALVGALLAAAVSWQVVVHIAEQRLGGYASMLLERAQELDDEARQTLDTFNRQPQARCTDPELEQMREAVYRTYFVKDIGRVEDGQLRCTGSLFRVPVPPTLAPAQLVTADGLGVSTMELQLLASGSRAPVLALGDTRVILDPLAFRMRPAPDIGFTMGYVDGAGGFLPLYGAATHFDAATLQAGGALDRDGVLVYPMCAPQRAVCVASSLSKAALFDSQWALLLVCTVLGAGAGAAVGLALLLAHLRRHSLEGRLLRAIDQDALDVEYQPVVRISDGALVGAEALVRWRDRDGRMVSPARFVPIAEENGSIGRITQLVLRRVADEFGDLLAAPSGFRINVNISAADLDNSRFHEGMVRTLDAAGIAPERIGIELTEHSTAARDIAVSGTTRLREQGHRVYIDDFGTGYSSLAYLAELDVYALKIDRSFTRTIGTDAVKVSLVPQIIDLARTLGLQVVIEGVETEAQRDWLRSVDYPLYAQGWLFGRPMPAAAFRERLAQQGR
ncbi:MAG: EAL domain-containing protein [Luteimonas sp.]